MCKEDCVTDPLINRQIDRYFIHERLQAGGMSIIYKAFDPQRKEFVAFKVLHRDYMDRPEIVSRFKQEAEIARKLNHPHIVPCYDFGEHDGSLYLVMRYMEGRSLSDWLHRLANVRLYRTLRWLTQIAQALDYAHSQGVVHHDLKPGNILLANDDDAFLSDFGVARVSLRPRATGPLGDTVGATARYISPELARGDPEIDYRSDLYSFGLIAYLLATGYYPFTSGSERMLIHLHINQMPPKPTSVNPDLPNAVNGVLLKCLAKDPAHRYGSAGAFVTNFRLAVTGYEDLMVIVNPSAANPMLGIAD
jgi:serine/threonine protein kinase